MCRRRHGRCAAAKERADDISGKPEVEGPSAAAGREPRRYLPDLAQGGRFTKSAGAAGSFDPATRPKAHSCAGLMQYPLLRKSRRIISLRQRSHHGLTVETQETQQCPAPSTTSSALRRTTIRPSPTCSGPATI